MNISDPPCLFCVPLFYRCDKQTLTFSNSTPLSDPRYRRSTLFPYTTNKRHDRHLFIKMPELSKRQEQIRDIAKKLRNSTPDDLEKVISYLAIVTHYIEQSSDTKKNASFLYTISVTQKVMETYLKMSGNSETNEISLRSIKENYSKHIEKAASQLEVYANGM